MACRVWLVEEYGYRNFVWTFPGSLEQLAQAWQSGRVPVNFHGPKDASCFDGELEETPPPWYDYCDIMAPDFDGEDEERLGLAIRIYESFTLEDLMRIWEFDAVGHVHEHDDTGITIGEHRYGAWWTEEAAAL